MNARVPPPGQLANHAADLIGTGQLEAAERLLKDSLRLHPNDAELSTTLGTLLGMRGQLPEAVKHLRRATKAAPQSDTAHYNLGQALISLGRHGDAVDALRTAAALSDKAHIHEKLGDSLRQLGKLEEAATHYVRAVDLDPANSLALSSAVETLRKICDWKRLDELQHKLIATAAAGAPVEPLLLLHVSDDPILQRKAAEAYWQALVSSAPATKRPARSRDSGKLRIAYLSGDFRQHPMVSVIAEAIELHDRSRFEVWGVSYGLDDGSPQRKRMERAFDKFVDVRTLSDAQLTARIAQSGIDILIDLAGYTANARLAVIAARPAPIICHYMGYPGTLGSPAYDYLIADRVVAPAGAETGYSEKLARLPACYWAVDRKRPTTTASTSRTAHGLPTDAVVLCSFNGQQKLAPELLDVWARILNAAPRSVLWLYSDNAIAAANLKREASARGIDASRLVIAVRVTPSDHLARIALADLMLDAQPYGGHTTTCDALWMGVPVLSVAGRAFASRVGASLLTHAGLPELAMPTLEDYEREAVRLANTPAALTELRAKLSSLRVCAPLFDTPSFTRALEAAFEQMWQVWQLGHTPRHFDADPRSNL